MRYILLTFGIVAAVMPRSVLALEYIFPLDTWNVSYNQGEDLGNGTYHMGVDAGDELEAGAAVYAVAEGVVKEVKERKSFGLVILIEHDDPQYGRIVSLYGHLDPADIVVQPGQQVQQAQRIGSLGSPSVNGGWGVHIHYGIHKEPYSPVWKYWGHVRDKSIQDKWFEPNSFTIANLAEDIWQPIIETTLQSGVTVGRSIDFSARVGDLGSPIESVKYRIRLVGTSEWSTVLDQSRFSGWRDISLPINTYPDGIYEVRIVAIDGAGLKKKRTYTIQKDVANLTSKGFASVSANKDNGKVSLWSKTAHDKASDIARLQHSWRGSNDIAVAKRGGGTTYYIARATSTRIGKVVSFNESGEKLQTLEPFTEPGTLRITAGPLDNGTYDELVVSSPPGTPTTVTAYNQNMTQRWRVQPFGLRHTVGADVVVGEVDANSPGNEVVVASRKGFRNSVAILSSTGQVLSKFRALAKGKQSGLNVAIGDVHPNEGNEIILGSEANVAGIFRIYSHSGEALTSAVQPFGANFTGNVDVATIQWDNDAEPMDAIVVSQGSKGQAWAKAYWYDGSVLYTKLLYGESHAGGARIAREP